MIRVAKAADTMAVIRLMKEALSRSRYRDRGEVDVEAAKAFLARCVHFHGHSGAGATFYLVSEDEDSHRPTGFFIACLGRVYVVGDKLEAQDVHLYLSGMADPKDFRRFVQAFDKWADANPDVIEATLSMSDFIKDLLGRDETMARFYQRRGYTPTNQVFKRRIERS
jgi:hypothetical protein